MLSMGGMSRRCCDGITRRDFLRIGSLGLGLTLADLLRLQAQGAVSPKARQKAVIMVYLAGGMSHIDTYDMKPRAPVEFRGEFKPIQTRMHGMDICELLPLQAKIADKFSLIRGVKAFSPNHGFFEQATGADESWKPRRPAIGSVLSRLRGERTMPQFVNLAVTAGNVLLKHDPSYLGAAHREFVPYGPARANLTLRIAPDRLADRKKLLHSFDTLQRDVDARQEMSALDGHQARALEMLLCGEVRDAFDLNREPDRLQARYLAANASQLLLARRLVESGVSLVTTLLTPPGKLNNGSWDTHHDNFNILRAGLPAYDAAVYTLLTDLFERGLDRDVLVVLWGEFGRTPRINKKAGRDHWANTNCVLLAGGGLRMGRAVGDSGPRGVGAAGKYSPQTIAAMIYHALGIDPATTLPDHAGRPIYLVEEREKIAELI